MADAFVIAGGSSESVYDPMRSVLALLRSEGRLCEPDDDILDDPRMSKELGRWKLADTAIAAMGFGSSTTSTPHERSQ